MLNLETPMKISKKIELRLRSSFPATMLQRLMHFTMQDIWELEKTNETLANQLNARMEHKLPDMKEMSESLDAARAELAKVNDRLIEIWKQRDDMQRQRDDAQLMTGILQAHLWGVHNCECDHKPMFDQLKATAAQ